MVQHMAFDEIKTLERHCPLCGHGAATDFKGFARDGWKLVSCDACGFKYLPEAPVYEALSETLGWTQQFKKEKKRRKTKNPVVQWLDDKTRWRLHISRDDEWAYICDKVATGRVLDVGCGNRSRVPERFTPFGIEIEKAAAEACHEDMAARGGRVIHAPALEGLDAFEGGFFDGIIMRSYLEHEVRPLEVLRAAHRALKPGGVIYVKVPNFGTLNRMVRGADWCGVRLPDHVNYFDVGSLRQMAEASGFRFELKNKATRFTNDNMHTFLTRLD